MPFRTEPPYRHGTAAKTGILLINLGTPDAPTAAAVKPYLREFLSDPRVVEIPRALWWPILNGIILNTRPKKSAEKYALIWTAEGSPLLVHTQRQAKLLQGYLGEILKTPSAQALTPTLSNPLPHLSPTSGRGEPLPSLPLGESWREGFRARGTRYRCASFTLSMGTHCASTSS